ncbi:MAG: M14 family zinc carboxypeptidase [Candidatus Thermoplasmatota archaeon]
MKKKVFVLTIALSLLFSGTLVAVGGESREMNKSTEINQDRTPTAEAEVDDSNLGNISNEYPFKDEYPSVGELYGWYEDLEKEYPNLIQNHSYGESYEGLDLYAWEITADNDTVVEEKPTILIDATIHAREWSTPQVAAYFTWRLLDEYDTNETINWIVNNRRIFVVPVVNPDGYIHDGNGTLEEREYWRKNRNDSTPTDAVGVDLNRNWDIHWEEGDDNASNETYHGEAPFSEPETYHLKEFMIENDIDSYQNLHSHWGTLLIPSTNMTDPTPHDDWYRGTAEHMTSLTTMLGEDEQYSYGQPHEEIGYSASGAADNWVYNEIGAQAYTYEIYTGEWEEDFAEGFYPPKEDIMTINDDLDDSLIYQTRVADADLGDGENLEHPPVPYLVYGTLENEEGDPLSDIEVEVENRETGEAITVETNSKGYYELNLANLIDHAYEIGDTLCIQIDPGTTMMNFNVNGNWGKRIDLEYTEEPQVTTESLSVLTKESAGLEGRVELGNMSSVEGYFQYRIEGDESWQESEREVIGENRTYDMVIDGLESDESYEVRATIDRNEEGQDYGRIMRFITTIHTIKLDSSVGGEVVKPGEGEFEYTYGSEVAIEVSAEEDYDFIEWIGDVDTVEDIGSSVTKVEMTDNLEIKALFQTGEGSKGDPYLIENVHHLQKMEDDLEAHYELATDIDAGQTENWSEGRGFDPIGSFNLHFEGTLNGNNYEIKNLHIDRSSVNYVGLFSYLGEESEVIDVHMIDAKVTGDYYVGQLAGGIGGTVRDAHIKGEVEGDFAVGGLAGGTLGTYSSSGKIEDSHSAGDAIGNIFVGGLAGMNGGQYGSGEIKRSSSNATVIANEIYAGGLVGFNIPVSTVEKSYATGDVTVKESSAGGLIGGNNEGTISESYATGDVSGKKVIGGMVGENLEGTAGKSDGLIERSYATGKVTSEGEWSGGLVGINAANISDSYATGDVVGDEKVGGLVGQVGYFSERQNQELEGEVSDSYSIGEVSGNDEETVGGLVGNLKYGEVIDSFWDVETSGQNESDGGNGLPTAEMVRRETFTDTEWDLEEDWNIIEEETYPFLEWQEEDTYPNAPEYSYFEVEIVDYDEEVEKGEVVTIDYILTNNGKVGDTQDIEFYVDDHLVDTEEDITLGESEVYEGEFTWTAEEAGRYDLELASYQDEKKITVEVIETYDLMINIEGEGTVEVDGEEVEDGWTQEYVDGTNVTLEAIPDDNWEFYEWKGTDTGEEITITMDEDKEITAVFEEEDDEILDDIPGFAMTLMLIASIIAVAIYQKKSKKR